MKKESLEITILQRGWVVVGLMRGPGDLRVGAVVRRWGTTRGLGQLAASGPQPATVLDFVEDMSWNHLSEVAIIKCQASAWQEEIKRWATGKTCSSD